MQEDKNGKLITLHIVKACVGSFIQTVPDDRKPDNS